MVAAIQLQPQKCFLDKIIGVIQATAAAAQQPPELEQNELELGHPCTMARVRGVGNARQGRTEKVSSYFREEWGWRGGTIVYF